MAKGSVFNHFSDNQGFGAAITAAVRLQLGEQISHDNAGVTDPVKRIAQGMRVGAEFALSAPKRRVVLLRKLIVIEEEADDQDHGSSQNSRRRIYASRISVFAIRIQMLYSLKSFFFNRNCYIEILPD